MIFTHFELEVVHTELVLVKNFFDAGSQFVKVSFTLAYTTARHWNRYSLMLLSSNKGGNCCHAGKQLW